MSNCSTSGDIVTLYTYLNSLKHKNHTVAFQKKAIDKLMVKSSCQEKSGTLLKADFQKKNESTSKVKTEDRRQSSFMLERIRKASGVSFVSSSSVPRRKVHHAEASVSIRSKSSSMSSEHTSRHTSVMSRRNTPFHTRASQELMYMASNGSQSSKQDLSSVVGTGKKNIIKQDNNKHTLPKKERVGKAENEESSVKQIQFSEPFV